MNHHSALVGLAALLALLNTGCMDREKLCFKHCEKGHECDEGDEGFIDLSNCKESCRDLVDETQEYCIEEMVRWSQCMKKRYDCDRGRENACESKRNDLRACLNANRN